MSRTNLGQNVSPVTPPDYVCTGFQQLDAAALTTAKPLTPPNNTSHAQIQCVGGTVRWRADRPEPDAPPTDAVGTIIADGDFLFVYEGSLAKIRLIAASGTPELNISYWG